LRTVAAKIAADDDRRASANHETIRRLLRGETVGSWLTVELIFETLCEIADVDPDDVEPDDGQWRSQPDSHRDELRGAWHLAVDGEFAPALPRTRSEREAQEERDRAEYEARQAAFAHRSSNSDEEPPF
jgi:hypothetical protein